MANHLEAALARAAELLDRAERMAPAGVPDDRVRLLWQAVAELHLALCQTARAAGLVEPAGST